MYRGMVYALSFGDTFILGLIGGVHCEEQGRATRKTSSSSSRLAQMLVDIYVFIGVEVDNNNYGWFIFFSIGDSLTNQVCKPIHCSFPFFKELAFVEISKFM